MCLLTRWRLFVYLPGTPRLVGQTFSPMTQLVVLRFLRVSWSYYNYFVLLVKAIL